MQHDRFGLKQKKLNFTCLTRKSGKELTRQHLSKCVELADRYGISKMTMEEITHEVKAVRKKHKILKYNIIDKNNDFKKK